MALTSAVASGDTIIADVNIHNILLTNQMRTAPAEYYSSGIQLDKETVNATLGTILKAPLLLMKVEEKGFIEKPQKTLVELGDNQVESSVSVPVFYLQVRFWNFDASLNPKLFNLYYADEAQAETAFSPVTSSSTLTAGNLALGLTYKAAYSWSSYMGGPADDAFDGGEGVAYGTTLSGGDTEMVSGTAAIGLYDVAPGDYLAACYAGVAPFNNLQIAGSYSTGSSLFLDPPGPGGFLSGTDSGDPPVGRCEYKDTLSAIVQVNF